MGTADQNFTFEPIEYQWTHEIDPYMKALFQKWNLAPGLVLKRYLVDPCIMKNEADVVSRCFCETMLGQLLGRSLNSDIPMELKELSCTAASMGLFEPLYKDSILDEYGNIQGCYDIDVDGILVQDKLRRLFATNYSTDSTERTSTEIFNSRDQNEFLFHIFRLIVIGGSLCQSETSINNYQDATRSLYRNIVHARNEDESIVITSRVFQVDPYQKSINLFDQCSPHNRCYLVVDELEHECTLIFMPYSSLW